MQLFTSASELRFAIDDENDNPRHNEEINHQQQETENLLVQRHVGRMSIVDPLENRHAGEDGRHAPDKFRPAGPANEDDGKTITNANGTVRKNAKPKPDQKSNEHGAEEK